MNNNFFRLTSNAKYYVNPNGNDQNNGQSVEVPFKTIQKAVDKAKGGDIINLSSGEYFQDVLSRRDGKENLPITIKGPANAVVKGNGNARIFEINHDYITLEGFTIDGFFDSSKNIKSYRDKLIYVLGKKPKNGIKGIKIINMTLKNAGGECVRLRYFAKENEVSYNNILNCGIYDFVFNTGKKNGEGVYIGTAPEQLDNGVNPTNNTDNSNGNRIHHNKINTGGNECVDIKEGSSENIVEYNTCTGQKDPESGGMDSRGNNNTFRFNEIFGNIGSGIRLGGDNKSDGIKNNIYGNTIKNNKGGGVKIQRMPQGSICENIMENNGKNGVGSFGSKFDFSSPCKF